MKKFVFLILVVTFLFGLYSYLNNGTVTKPKHSIELKANSVYKVPINPDEYQAKLYNNLTKSLDSMDDLKIVKLVSQNFASDFFTLRNKKSDEIGGLTYILESERDDFKSYAMQMITTNYQKLEEKYGSSHLPNVTNVKIEKVFDESSNNTTNLNTSDKDAFGDSSTTQISSNNVAVNILVKYEKDEEIPNSILKTKATLHLEKKDGAWYIIGID